MIARAHRAGLHEILPRLPVEAGAHEHVQHIVNMQFCLVQRQACLGRQGAGQVGMAAMVIRHARQQHPGIRIAAGANHVMYRSAIGVDPVPAQAVLDDGRHRPHGRKARPKPMPRSHMRTMQRPRLAREETLGQVACIPQVQIAHLRPVDARYAKEAACRHAECRRFAGGCVDGRRHRGTGQRAAVQPQVWQRQGFGRIADHRRNGAADIGINRLVWHGIPFDREKAGHCARPGLRQLWSQSTTTSSGGKPLKPTEA